MNIDDLKYFSAAAKHGSMRKAAEELHVTQPALSHAIKRLEVEFKIMLFHRQSRGVTLSDAGARFLEGTEEVLAKWSGLKKITADSSELLSGRIRFGCHSMVAHYAVPQFLPEFQRKYPGVEFNFSHNLSRRLNREISEGALDIGIIINPIPGPGLVIKKLGFDEIGMWQAKNGSQSNTVIYDPNLAQSQNVLKKLSKRDIEFEHHILSDDLGVILQMVKIGLGAGLLPGRAVEETSLIRLYRDVASFKDEIALVFKPEFRQKKVGRALIEHLQSSFK